MPSGDNNANSDISIATEQWLSEYLKAYKDHDPPPGLYQTVLHKLEEPLISVCLAYTRGNQIKAAELLGVNRNTLRKKIRDLDIQVIRAIR